MGQVGISFQKRVLEWLKACFGEERATDPNIRVRKFAEEAAELCQACDLSEEDLVTIVRSTYAREKGSPLQEVGGVMLTLSGLCSSRGIDMWGEAETELGRVLGKVEKIRAKERIKTAVDFGHLEGSGDARMGQEWVVAKASIRAAGKIGMTDEEYAACLGICEEAVEEIRRGRIGLPAGEPAFARAVDLISVHLDLTKKLEEESHPAWMRAENDWIGESPMSVMTSGRARELREYLERF